MAIKQIILIVKQVWQAKQRLRAVAFLFIGVVMLLLFFSKAINILIPFTYLAI
jgi:hypothetical protein